MTLSRTARWTTALVAATVAALPVVVGATPASAAVTQQSFSYAAGQPQSFTVPTGVTTIFVTAIGASGGAGGGSSSGHTGGAGGLGGSVSAALPVTPGQVLDIWIGNAGGDAGAKGTGANSSGLKPPSGSYVFGGAGGLGDGASLARGGGGAGVTAITTGGIPLVAAGGGGGGGGADGVGDGGAGGSGGPTAGDGGDGTGTGGGTGGHGAQAGLSLSGGAGQTLVDFNGAGGGGGAGWLVTGPPLAGGGGGGYSVGRTIGSGGGGGGGAGTTSVAANGTNVHISTATQRGPGSVFLSWDQPATTTFLSTTGDQLPGDTTTLLATPTPATRLSGDPLPTGTVTFYDGNSALGTVPLSPFGGSTASASFRPASLTPGLHAFSASYNGDAVYAGSTSPTSTLQVDAVPAITSAASASGVVGQPVSFLVRATGFPLPTVIATGSLDGLTLTGHADGTATLAGRPLTAGTFPVTLTAANGLLPAAVQRFTFTATLSPLTISPAALPPAYVGQAYSAALAAVGGTPPVTWAVTAGRLPAGLSLNHTTGTVTGVPTTAGSPTFTVTATDATNPTRFTASRTIRLPVTGIVPAVYVANGANDSVTSYPLGGSGGVAPTTRLAGTGQGLNAPSGLVLDAAGRLYVADGGSASITEYDRGATTPTLTLAGPATGLAGPAGLTLDGSGRLVVADRTANAVLTFVPGVSGNTGPAVTLTGPDTGLASPAAVAVDGGGRLWVANSAANSLTAYAPGATGDAKPLVTIAGSATGLRSPQALTVDGAGDLLVANTFGASITVYAPTASGNALPLRTISGSSTGLGNPAGIDVDTAGRIYVSDEFANTITSYPATANGDVVPLATLSGAATGLSAPGALAITPPLSVLTGALPTARVGHTFAAALSAGEGTSPYRWSLAGGQLPPGLRLTAAGAIAGTPLRAGRWAVTVRVSDSAAGTAVRRLSLTVAPR